MQESMLCTKINKELAFSMETGAWSPMGVRRVGKVRLLRSWEKLKRQQKMTRRAAI
jgi:hypothetical protein